MRAFFIRLSTDHTHLMQMKIGSNLKPLPPMHFSTPTLNNILLYFATQLCCALLLPYFLHTISTRSVTHMENKYLVIQYWLSAGFVFGEKVATFMSSYVCPNEIDHSLWVVSRHETRQHNFNWKSWKIKHSRTRACNPFITVDQILLRWKGTHTSMPQYDHCVCIYQSNKSHHITTSSEQSGK